MHIPRKIISGKVLPHLGFNSKVLRTPLQLINGPEVQNPTQTLRCVKDNNPSIFTFKLVI